MTDLGIPKKTGPQHRPLRVGGQVVPYPEPTPASSRVMQGNRKVDTSPEVQLRSALHRAGYRFRKNAVIQVEGLRVRPDLVFQSAKLAVFCDGCYWHGCPEHFRPPRSNTEYWTAKIQHNQMRDRFVDEELTSAGWTVVRIWEHDSIHMAFNEVVESLPRRS